MADHFQLTNFEVKYGRSGDLILLLSGGRKYYEILSDAFNSHFFSRVFEDRNNRFDWGTYVKGVNEPERQNIERLLRRFQQAVCIDDALKQTFALSYHFRPAYEGGRTEIGDLVYKSKPYHGKAREQHRSNAKELAKHFITFIKEHPSYLRSDYILSVPANPGKSYDLPSLLVAEICDQLRIANGSQYISKVKQTSMKDCSTLEQKMNEIYGAFSVREDAPFNGKRITVIDDIYHTGVTLHELAITLQKTGALVQGLVATKTLSDLS